MRFSYLFIASLFLFGADTASAEFSDVPLDHPNHDAIQFVQEAHIVEGYPDGKYHPSNLINRAEFTKIIMNSIADQRDIESCISKRHFSDIWQVPLS